MNEMIKIKNVSLKDLNSIDKIDSEAFGVISYPKFVLRQYIDCFQEFFKIAIIDSEVVGYIIGGIKVNSKIGYGLSVATDKEHLRKGIAMALIKELIDEFQKAGLEKLRLTVDPLNKGAFKLYEKLGFEKILYDENYYGSGEKRYVMEIEIKNVNILI